MVRHLLVLWYVLGIYGQTAFGLTAVEVAWLNGAAGVLSRSGPSHYRNNLEQLLDRIDCNRVDCSPRAICQYLNLGAFLPRSCLDEPQELPPAQSREDKLFEVILGSMPRPDSCKTSTPLRPIPVGTIAIDLNPSIVDLGAFQRCQAELEQRRLQLSEKRDEVLRYFNRVESGFFRVSGRPAIYWSNGENAYCHVPSWSVIGEEVRQYRNDIVQDTGFAFHGGCRYSIEVGFFQVQGDIHVYLSNGKDAYCWVPHPKYLTQPVRTYDFDIHSHTTFRKNGKCPGME